MRSLRRWEEADAACCERPSCRPCCSARCTCRWARLPRPFRPPISSRLRKRRANPCKPLCSACSWQRCTSERATCGRSSPCTPRSTSCTRARSCWRETCSKPTLPATRSTSFCLLSRRRFWFPRLGRRNWQTRTVQVRMGATPWRFKSSRPHHLKHQVRSQKHRLLTFFLTRWYTKWYTEIRLYGHQPYRNSLRTHPSALYKTRHHSPSRSSTSHSAPRGRTWITLPFCSSRMFRPCAADTTARS